MSRSTQYLIVSLPTSISQSDSYDETFQAISALSSRESGTAVPFRIPEFKIGTLEALVQQADELDKLETTCDSVVAKVGESLKSILEGDESKIEQQKIVNDKPVDQYLKSFNWNKVKYREDRSLSNLIEILSKEVSSIDNDVRTKYSQYNQVKTNLAALQKRQTGNLSNKSLASVVPRHLIVQDSEYLETHLVAVPCVMAREFLKHYETISPWVVPRSAINIASDSDFTLFAVTTFKKHSAEFVHKCREQKWTPRDYKYEEGSLEKEKEEMQRVSKEERKLWGEVLRIARTNWGEAVMAWIHVIALRVFVESVLRYGLPLSFASALIKTNPKITKKLRTSLDQAYGYLAGNALGRDKKGRVVKDDADMQATGQAGDVEYSAYVCYDFEIN